MAWTVTTLQPARSGFCIHADGNFENTEELLAAPGVGKSIYLESVTVGTQGARTLAIGAGETANALTTMIWAAICGLSFHFADYEFDVPIKLPANTALCGWESSAGGAYITVQGYVK